MHELRDILWAERTRDELPDWAERGTVVVQPIGSIEQHGLHLPLDTDCRTVEHVAREAARRAQAPVLVTPTLPYGVSPHHLIHPGAISLGVETVLHVLRDVCSSLVHHGFERILILSGHGGNSGTISAAALELSYRFDRRIEAFAWFDLVPEAFEAVREGPRVGIGHAGEMETSAILHLAPDSVRPEKYALVRSISDHPARGAAPKGERVLAAAAEALARHLEQMAAAPSQDMVGIETAEEKGEQPS